MFVNKNYYLTAEISDKLSNHLALYSVWSSMDDLIDSGEIIKMGRSVFVKKDSRILSYNLKERLAKLDMSDYSHLVPIPYLKKEFNFNINYCLKNNLGVVIEKKFNTFGKSSDRKCIFEFFQFKPDIEKKLKMYTLSHIKKEDLELVKDYIQVSNKDYIGLY